MKDKIIDILEKHYHGRNYIEDRCADEIIELLSTIITPPNDIEIKTWATYECGGCSNESNDERIGLIFGARWMREKCMELIKK